MAWCFVDTRSDKKWSDKKRPTTTWNKNNVTTTTSGTAPLSPAPCKSLHFTEGCPGNAKIVESGSVMHLLSPRLTHQCAKHVTISTVGIAFVNLKLADEAPQISVALSLDYMAQLRSTLRSITNLTLVSLDFNVTRAKKFLRFVSTNDFSV